LGTPIPVPSLSNYGCREKIFDNYNREIIKE
jgi:hypothetical protein